MASVATDGEAAGEAEADCRGREHLRTAARLLEAEPREVEGRAGALVGEPLEGVEARPLARPVVAALVRR